MSKHIRKRKLQFIVSSLMAVSFMLGGSVVLKNMGAHKLILTKEALAARVPPGLRKAVVAPDVAYAYDKPALLPPAAADEHPQTVPVLLYHGLVAKRDRFSMTPETFRDQMFALKRNGFNTITLQQYLDFRNGKELPPRSFLLTFDDGRADSYIQADPVLKAVGFSAVMFVAGDASLDDPKTHNLYYLNRLDLLDMVATGRWEIASHALQEGGGQIPIDDDGTHANFLSNKKWLIDEGRLEGFDEYSERVIHELLDNKTRLEYALGIKVLAFSYPYGDFGNQQLNNPDAEGMIAKVLETSYPIAFRQVWPNDVLTMTNTRDTPALMQKRIEVPTYITGDELVDSLKRVIDKPLPLVDGFDSDAGWRSTWGKMEITGGDMILSATEKSTGADAQLDGTETWSDYVMSAHYDWVKGSRFTLMGRYTSDSYLQCSFGGGRVRLDRVEGDRVIMVAESESTQALPTKDGIVSMRLQGTNAECLVGGQSMLYGTVPEGRGSIGLKVWDQTFNNAELRVHQVRAVATEPEIGPQPVQEPEPATAPESEAATQ